MPTGVRPVRIVESRNPLRPDVTSTEVFLEPRPGESVSECMARIGMDVNAYAIRLNGKILHAGEEPFHPAMPGSELICVAAAGGGALKIVAMVGLLAVTTALTGGFGDIAEAILWSSVGITTAATAGVVAAAISIGGGLLISATLGGASGQTKSAGVTYDPDGPKTLAQPGTPIPKGYGKMGWGGNIIASFVDQDGQDEYLNILVGFGFGQAIGMTTILLNGKPISAYPDLAYAMRLGTNDQTPIPGFDRIVNTYSQQVELLAANGPTIATGQGLNTTGLQVAVKFPGGLMRTDSGGNPKECSLAYLVEISPGGQNQWTTPIFPKDTTDVYTIDANGYRHYPYWVVMPTDRYAGSGIVYSTDTNEGAHTPGESWENTESVKVYNIDNTNYTYNATFQGEWQMTADITLDLQSVTDWWGGYRIVSNMTDQSFYDIVNIFGLVAGKWDVRVTKYGAGPHNQPIPQGDGYMTDPHYTADAWLWDVSELQFTDLSYPNQVLLGIRALATTQISGADITVNATITHVLGEDTVIPAALSGFELDNPALVAYDILANPLYGMAATNPNLAVDVPAFARWAQFCDEQVMGSAGASTRRFVFAGVFDQGGSNAWQVIQQVGSMARAQILQVGNEYTCWIDAPTDITQIFTEANIMRGSYSENFIDYDSRAACIEVEFADAARTFRTDLPVSVMSAATINSGQQPKITRTNLLGCTSRDQAWQWAYFHLISTETLLRTATWKCGAESLSCRQGSVVGVQQRQWCTGGRIQAGSTENVLVIDRTDVPAYTVNAGWTVGVQHPIFSIGTATVTAVSSTGTGSALLTFAAALPAGRIMKVANAAGGELAVSGYSATTISGDFQGAAFAVGQSVTLYDYDRIELLPVTGLIGTQMTVQGSFSQVPTPDAPWVYGQSGGTAPYKLFRVTSIKQTGDLSYAIGALDYSLALYEDVVPQYGAVFDAPVVNATVSGLTLTEKLQNTTLGAAQSAQQALITVDWSNGTNTSGADIYGQVDGGAWNHMAHVLNSTYSFLATTGDVWQIKVVGFDRLGVAASYADGPTATITVQGTGAAPHDVTAFSGSFSPSSTGGTILLTWNGGTTKVGVTSPGSFGGSFTVDPNFAFYEIRFSAASNPVWGNAALVATSVATTSYAVTSPQNGTYMVKEVNKASVESINAALWLSTGISSQYNAQGSLVPSTAIEATYTLTQPTAGSWTLEVDCAAQTLTLSDGSTVSIPASSLTWTGLASATTYYIYTYLNVADLTLHDPSGDPPVALPTEPSAAIALQSASDGRYQGPMFAVTTGATVSGGGSAPITGGGTPGACPASFERVHVLERGHVEVGTVVAGEHVAGWCFSRGRNVFREVRAVSHTDAAAWHIVSGRRVTPMHPVIPAQGVGDGANWRLPFELGEYSGAHGTRVKLDLLEEEYDEKNYWIIDPAGVPILLMHNYSIQPITQN
jgi:hypothetical protein